jgi:hypothetical protein
VSEFLTHLSLTARDILISVYALGMNNSFG